MNEDQVTTLLDRLGRDIDVSTAPVVAVTEDGRRRMRRRHGAQVMGVAAAVLALTGGGVVVQQQFANDDRTTTQPPVVGPSVDELVGSWKPIMLAGNPAPQEGLSDKPIAFTFEHGKGQQLVWSGNDGCNQVGGAFLLGRDGAFRLGALDMTLTNCLGYRGSLPFSGVSAVKNATHIQLTAGRLTLTSASGTRLGVFVRYRPTEPAIEENRLPGRAPTKASLLGIWRPLELHGIDVSNSRRQFGEPVVVSFEGQTAILANSVATDIRWRGYDGCNWTSGWVLLGLKGAFSTRGDGSTLRGCLGAGGHSYPYGAFTEVDVIRAATRVRLVDGDLHFFGDKSQPLGIFTEVQAR